MLCDLFCRLKELQALWLAENQTKPLIRLQPDIDIDTGQRMLTCYLLPQMPEDREGKKCPYIKILDLRGKGLTSNGLYHPSFPPRGLLCINVCFLPSHGPKAQVSPRPPPATSRLPAARYRHRHGSEDVDMLSPTSNARR